MCLVSEASLLDSPLLAEHEALGARLVPFAGWRMPVQYAGILPEHHATRTACGVFDISHMGQLRVGGEGAGQWLDGLLTNRVADLAPGQCHYTLMLNEAGGVIDDLILYALEDRRYLLIVNASKTGEDEAWLRRHLAKGSGVLIENVSDDYAGLAVQGPNTVAIAQALWEGKRTLPGRNRVEAMPEEGGEAYWCRTGYTGEDGFELFLPVDGAADYWRKLLALGVTPCGLGARDTLRLEMGYPLSGADLLPDRSPLEAGLGFFVDLEKGDFVGRGALLQQKREGLPVRLAGLSMADKGPPLRPGYAVLDGEKEVGALSSGCLSPSLGKGIGMAYLPVDLARSGKTLEMAIRGRRFSVTTVKKPFYRPGK